VQLPAPASAAVTSLPSPPPARRRHQSRGPAAVHLVLRWIVEWIAERTDRSVGCVLHAGTVVPVFSSSGGSSSVLREGERELVLGTM